MPFYRYVLGSMRRILRIMSTFQIFGQLQKTSQVPLWIVILDFLNALLRVGPVFRNCPKICSFQDGSNCISRIQFFLNWISGLDLAYSCISFLEDVLCHSHHSILDCFLLLLKYLGLVSTHECFLASDLLDNLI